jgi:hypothetical protein
LFLVVTAKYVMLQRADVNSSDFKHVNCSEGLTLAFLESGKLLRWSVRYLRGLTSVGAYYFDTGVGMYLFFLSQIDFL